MECAHTGARDDIRSKILGETRTFNRRDSHIQEILNAARNCKACASFVKEHDLDGKLF